MSALVVSVGGDVIFRGPIEQALRELRTRVHADRVLRDDGGRGGAGAEMSANPYRDTSSGLPETHNHKPLRYAEANAWDEGHASGAAEERERIWRGVRALIWMVERHPTKDVIYDAHIRRLARDLKAAHGALRNFYSKHRSPS